MPKSQKKAKKPSRIVGFFSRVGGGVTTMGGSAAKAVRHVGRAVTQRKAPEKGDEVTRRLQELKRLETLREEERAVEREMEEEKVWEERAELKRPLSERLAGSFYSPLKRPAQRMTKFFKGLDEDLYKANLAVPPERYVALMLGMSLIVGIIAFVLVLLFVNVLLALVAALGAFFFTLLIVRTHPKSKAKARVVEVNRTLPYALRHMATQLSSGIGLPETMTSVSQADYGALSEEFGRVIHDMHAGSSMDEALSTMDKRVGSEPLRRAIRQVQRTVRTGGDLARTLGVLADETALELRMKLRDYTQSLNLMAMLYMFASAVIPALLVIMMMVVGMQGAGGFAIDSVAVLFLFLLPFLLLYVVMMIKRREPRV